MTCPNVDLSAVRPLEIHRDDFPTNVQRFIATKCNGKCSLWNNRSLALISRNSHQHLSPYYIRSLQWCHRWFPSQRPMTQSFDVFFDLHLNKRLSKQWRSWWFQTSWRSLLCHCNSADVQGAVSIRKTVLPGMAIPMLKIRRPNGRLIFNMEIAIRR